MVGLGCADTGSTDPLLGTPRSEPVRELVRDMECCWLSFPFSFSIRSETSVSFAETSTGLDQLSIFFGANFQRWTNLAAPNGFGRLVLTGLGDEGGETTVDALVDLGVSSSFLRAGVGGVDWFGLVLPLLDIGRFFLQSPSSEGGGGRFADPPPSLLPPPGGGTSSDDLNLDPIVQVSPSTPGVESPPPNPLLLWRRPSESPEDVLGGAKERLVDRQSLMLSETLEGGGCLSPSNRRRDESRESLRSGSGPSRLHGPSNFESSSNPPGPPIRSFAALKWP